MKTNFKRLLSLLLTLVMLGSMLPTVYADNGAVQPENNSTVLTDEDYAIVNDVFAQIDAMEDAPAKKNAKRSQIVDAAMEIVMASDNYVEGSLERNGNCFTWWTEEGIRCIYNPYLREKHDNMQAPEEAQPAGIYNEPKTTRGGWPTGNQVYLIGPYYGLDDSFTDQYKNEAASIAKAVGDTDGYTLYSGSAATIDKVADAVESGAVVIFDSHGTTDSEGSYICLDPDGYEVYDYVSDANYSYLCLTTKTGITSEDYTDGAAYFVDSEGDPCACVNGAAIVNHMEKNSPSGLLWMAICLGMATDTFSTPLRAKGVEVVYGYSQSVTFAGDYLFEETFWDNMIAGKDVATSVAAMKSKWGKWDWSEPIASYYGYSGTGYTLSQAQKYRSAFPVVVSDEDAHPGQRGSGTNYGACSEQTVKSTYTLYNQYEITASSNNTAYGTVSVSGSTITAKPATGYFAQGYTVLSGSATVSQNGNTFSVMAGSDCAVQINFAPKTAVTVNFSGANVAGQTGYAGDSMTLPTATAPEGYKFLGWMTSPLDSDTTEKPSFYTDSFIPTGSTTLYALYSYVEASADGGSGDYVKVTATPDDWSGEYLIVYEPDSRVFNGSLTTLEATSNYQTVTIDGDTISAEEADAYRFIIASMDGGYSIQSASGMYISGTAGANKLTAGSTPAVNTINIDAAGNADIVSNTSHLRYNATSGQDRFRYYKSASYSNQKNIALYVKDGSAGVTYYTTSLCDHENTASVAGTSATCTQEGYTAGVQCTDCGSFVSGHQVIPALGHSFGAWNVTTQPTCTEPGVQAHTCSACGVSETQSIPATGHNTDNGVVTTPATCTQEGVITFTCSDCGEASTEAIPAAGHSYVANGLTYTCSVCGHSYTVSASTTLQYVFSEYTAGTQYAQGETHELDEIITLIINGAHLNTQIRLYNGSNAVFASQQVIESIQVKAGYKAGILNVYGSFDGTSWELIAAQDTTTSYVNYSFDMPQDYTYVMLEGMEAQVRVTEMTIVVSGGAVAEPEPTEPEVTEPEVTEPEVTEPAGSATGVQMVTNPTAGTAYKLYLEQDNLGKTLYFAGTTANKEYYLATTEDVNAATDVYLEAAADGYYLYFMDGDTKTYIDMYVSGNYYNLRLAASSSVVYTYDSTYNTLIALNSDTNCFIGTYNTFDTMSCCKETYLTGNFVSHLGLPTTAQPDPEEPTEPDVTEPIVSGSATIDFSTTAHRVSWDANSQVWANAGAMVTNNKANSTSDIIDSSNPVRFYKYSDVIISFPGMTKIEVTCSSEAYAAALAGAVSNATVSTDGAVVTVTLAEAASEFTVTLTAGQVRMSQLTVYGSSSHTHSYEAVVTAPTCTADGFTTYTCAGCGDSYTADTVSALGHSYSSIVVAPTPTSQGYTVYTCSVCGHSYEDSYVDPIVLPSGNDRLRIIGAALTLGADLKIRFTVHADTMKAHENVYFVFRFAGQEITVSDYTTNADQSRYYFDLPGVAPRMMNDTVEIFMYGTYQGYSYEYTNTYKAADYCYSQLRSSGDVKLKTLIVDLLNFATQHQAYMNYNMENPVNGGLTAEQAALASTHEMTYTSVFGQTGTNNGASFRGAALTLTDAVVVRYTVKCENLTEDTTLEVSVAGRNFSIPASEFVPTDTADVYYVSFRDLAARQMRATVSATVCRGGVAISKTATYSVETYASTVDATTDLGKLVKAMMYYGDSAKAFLG